MMKRFHVLLMASLSGWAFAEPAKPEVASPTPAARGAYVDLAPSNSGFDCSPAPIGNGTMPTVRSNAAGTVAWWYCATANGEWRVNWAAATATQMSVRNMFAEFRAVLLAADPKAAFTAAVAKNVKVPVNSPSLLAVWQPFVAEMNAGKPVALPTAHLMAPAPSSVAAASMPTMP